MQNGEVGCIVTGDVGRALHASHPDVLVVLRGCGVRPLALLTGMPMYVTAVEFGPGRAGDSQRPNDGKRS